MAGWREPIGPEPARVYWVRRAIVVIAILAVIGVIWALIAALHPPAKPAATPTAKHSTAAPWMTSAPAAPATTSAAPVPATSAATPTRTPTPTPVGPVACDPAHVTLKVSGAQSVKSGDGTKFTLDATNDSGSDCVLDVSPQTTRLVITSGDVQVWSTGDCDQWLGVSKKETLGAGKSIEWTTDWGTRRSAAGCNILGDYLQPGTYVARLSYQDRAQGSLVMVLHG